MQNGVRIRGLSGDVSSVSVKSNVHRTWALIGRKWMGLRYKEHDVPMNRDELLALRVESGQCVLEIECIGDGHGAVIVQEDVSRFPLRRGEKRRFNLRKDGAALVLTTSTIHHPFHRHGPIIET